MVEEIVAGSTKLCMDYLSFHPTYQDLRDLKRRVRQHFSFSRWRLNLWFRDGKIKAVILFSRTEERKRADRIKKGKLRSTKWRSRWGKEWHWKQAYSDWTLFALASLTSAWHLVGLLRRPQRKLQDYSLMLLLSQSKLVVMKWWPRIFAKILYIRTWRCISWNGLACQDSIPTAHPDSSSFELRQPFLDNRYDIAICGAAVGRYHPRESYRSDCESQRLMVSQLVFAMHRLKPGGSVVLLLHRIESWDTVCILHAFNEFSDIQLYKHRKAHAIKSSFYLVAKRVNMEHDTARESMGYWKSLWRYLTFEHFKEIPLGRWSLYESDDVFVQNLRDNFGPQFLRLAEPIWKIQAEALRNARFIWHA